MSTHVGDIFFDVKLDDKEYQSGLKKLNTSATKVGSSIGKKIALGLGAIGFGAFIKKATDAGASLNAMGTIIDASLPNMTEKVDRFAKSAGSAFGLSETQAKGFVGKYASMASAMGYTEEQAYKMSTALTGLAGDVASYYHISADDAYAKLGAVFTGETEALKQLGVVMTQNALDTFALERGYGATTNQLSELEKTTLRYNFVLDRLRLASGDFAKYANTWSGSIATIKLNWSNFMATIGQGIINILLPLLQLIARISQALTALGSRFVAWTRSVRGLKTNVASVFGKKTQADLKTANTGIGNVGKGLGGVGKNAGSAKKAVQALKRELLGFDKITKLTGEKGTSSGGAGTGGAGGGLGDLGGIGIDDGSIAGTAENYVDKFIEQLKKCWEDADFSPIGRMIGSKINQALNAIDWDVVSNGINKVAKSLATLLSGFIEETDWGLVTKSISKAIETAVGAVTTFISNIDWRAVGKAIVDAIAGIDFIGLLKSAFDLKNALYDAIYGSVKGAFDEVCKKIADLLGGIREAITKTLTSSGGSINITLGLKDNFTSAWNKIKGTWNSIKSRTATVTASLSDKFSSVWKKIKSGWNSLKSKTVSVKLAFTEAIKTKWNAIARKVNDARAKGGIAKTLLPAMPYLAQGGYVKANTPQLAVIGDNKREGEIVAPESKLMQMARMASEESNAQTIAVLRQILLAIDSLDLDVKLDGESIKRNTVRRINQHTKATGKLEIIV